MGVPTIIGQGGVHNVLEWELASDEHEELEHSINILKVAMNQVL